MMKWKNSIVEVNQVKVNSRKTKGKFSARREKER